MKALRVLDLFSGIGAYSLGLERTGGFKTVAFCELEDFPVRVLNKHWPEVPVYRDVKQLTADTLRRDGIAVDVICGGWPCQDISVAGSGLGLDGARSGLWSEVARLAGDIRPRLLILENSSNLLTLDDGRWFGQVLGDLAALGYDAEWHCLSAAAFDAPHIRDRVWIVATRSRDAADADSSWQLQSQGPVALKRRRPAHGDCQETDADATGDGRDARRAHIAAEEPRGRQPDRAHIEHDLADLDGAGLQVRPESSGRTSGPLHRAQGHSAERGSSVSDAHGVAALGAAIARQERISWQPESGLVRVVHGAANRVDRIHALGNCNPPQIIEAIGRALLSTQEQKK